MVTARRRILAGLGANLYARGVLVLGQVLLVPVLVTRWTADGYGEWVALSAIASYLSYTNLGMPGALRAHMAMEFSKNGHAAMQEAFQSALILVAAVGAVVGVAFELGLPLVPLDRVLNLSWMSRTEAFLVAAILGAQLVIYATSSVFSASVSSIGRYPQANLYDAHRQTAELASMLLVVGVFRGSPVQAAMIFPITWSLYTMTLAYDLARHAPWLYERPWRVRPATLRDLAKPMAGVLGMTFGYVGMSIQAPRIILAATAGPRFVAAYAVAAMMTRIARIPIDLPAHSATVEISLASGSGDLVTARGLLSNTTRICLWIAILTAPAVILLGPKVAWIWSNQRVAVPRDLLVLMCISTLLFAISLSCQEGLMAVGKLHRATKWLLWGAVPYLALCWILARHFREYGVATAVVMLELTYAAAALAAVTREFDLSLATFARGILAPPFGMVISEVRRWRPSAGKTSAGNGRLR